MKNQSRFLINNIVRIFKEFCYIGFLNYSRIILKLEKNITKCNLYLTSFFHSLISYSYSLHCLNRSGFLYHHSSFRLIIHTVNSTGKLHVRFIISVLNTLHRFGSICRIFLRIWLNNVATNCNIISNEYDEIFLYSLFLKFNDDIV